MTPTPMARAVEAAQMIPPRAREGCKCTHGPDEEDAGLCPPCYMCPECDAAWYAAILRAALPALLDAVTEEMGPDELEMLASTLYSYLCGANVYPAGLPASRAALLAALTDAAGRLP